MPETLDQLLMTTSQLIRHGDDGRDMRRKVARGDVVRIKRGAFVSAAEWTSLRPWDRQKLLATAFAETHPTTVFSHHTAAAVHGLPIVGGWPAEVHAAAERATGGRSEPGLRRHCRGLNSTEITTVGGISVTTVERTLVDLALIQPFRWVVSPIDAALRQGLVNTAGMLSYLYACGKFRGRAKAQRAIAFGNRLAANPGESLSRATIHELGFPKPLLQVEHPRSDGFSDFTDFEWPAVGVIGEFDGMGKYFREEFMGGRTADDVVYREKLREDRLRADARRFARWGWMDAWRIYPLRDILLRAGLAPAR